MIGLWEQAQRSNRVTYQPKSLTLADLMKAVEPLRDRQPPKMTIYTSGLGVMFMEIAMDCENNKSLPRYWVYIPKRTNERMAELSIGKKHSLVKIRIYPNRSEFRYVAYYGTTKKAETRTFTEAVNRLKKYL